MTITGSRVGRLSLPLLAAFLAAVASGCRTTNQQDPVERDNVALLVNVYQEVVAYFNAANENNVEQVRRLRERIQPRVDGNLPVFREFLLSGKKDDDRMMAACILGFSTSRSVVPLLVEALGSPSDGLRHHACLGLGTFAYTGTPAEPVVKLLTDPSAVVRRDAAWVLSRILSRGQGSVFLIEDDVQDWGAFCLKVAQEADASAAPGRRLFELVPQDVRDLVRDSAQRGSFLDTNRSAFLRALNAVIRRRDFYSEKDFAMVEIPAAAQALLAKPRAGLAERDVEMLNRLLLEAAYPSYLAPAQGRERGWALAAFLKALEDEDYNVRCSVIIALGRLASPEAVEPLIRKGLSDHVREVRINAACHLGLIGDRRAVEPLIQAMRENQQDPDMLNAIKFGLREITGQDFGGSYTNWRAWWEEQKQPPPRMPGQETAPDAGKKEAPKADAEPGKPAPAPPAAPAPQPPPPAPPK